MTRGPQRVSLADRLAYVDDCLPRIDRTGVEETMREDAELKREIALWQAQNEAIRAAFPDHAAKRGAAAGWTVADWLMVPDLTRQNGRGGESEALASDAGDVNSSAPPPAPVRDGAKWQGWARIACGVCIAVGMWAGAAILFPGNGAAPFAKAAMGAYRTYAEGRTHAVEIATSDRNVLARWFVAQMAGASPVPDLTAAGLTLVGGRIVPGAYAPAALLVYENPRRDRFLLETEGVDAPPETALAVEDDGGVLCAVWTGAGYSFALVGRASRARLTELARLVRD